MVFSSLLFLFRFLPAVLILYFLAPRRWRNLVLLLFSLAFYLDPGLLYRRDSRGPLFAAGALPIGARGTDRIIGRESVAAWIFQVCGFCDWDGEQPDRV